MPSSSSDLTSSHAVLQLQREDEARRQAALAAEPDAHTIDTLMAAAGLDEQLINECAQKTSLDELLSRLKVNRPLFLEYLREIGLSKLNDRQKLANVLAKAERLGQLPAATMALPHLKVPEFEEDDGKLTVRLQVPGGTATNQLNVKVEATRLTVQYCNGPTAAHGTLGGRVLAADAFWEIERTPRPEYDPMLDATAQPPPPEDTLVVTLPKAGDGARWVGLFADAVATRRKPPPVPEDAEAARVKAEWEAHLNKRRHQMLYGKDVTPLPPKPAALLKLEAKERVERERRIERRRLEEANGHAAHGGSVTAKEHWQPAKATLLWRDGLTELAGAPDHPADCAPLYTWRETKEAVVVCALTGAARAAAELRLEAGANFVDCFVGGVATPWCGVLCGRVDPSRCAFEVVHDGGDSGGSGGGDSGGSGGSDSGGAADGACAAGAAHADVAAGVCATLRLTLVKESPHALWRAPWPELLPHLDVRERKAAAAGVTPRREWLTVGGWDEEQSGEAWTLVLPLRAGGALRHDDLRVGVTADTFNVHLAGHEDAPLVGGALYGRIAPARCGWHMRAAAPVGTMAVEELVLRLAKEAPGSMWKALIKTAYT